MSRFDDEDEIPIPAGMRREFDRLKGTAPAMPRPDRNPDDEAERILQGRTMRDYAERRPATPRGPDAADTEITPVLSPGQTKKPWSPPEEKPLMGMRPMPEVASVSYPELYGIGEGTTVLHAPSGVVGVVKKAHGPGEYRVAPKGVETSGRPVSEPVVELEDGNAFLFRAGSFVVLDKAAAAFHESCVRSLVTWLVNERRVAWSGGVEREVGISIVRAVLSAQLRALSDVPINEATRRIYEEEARWADAAREADRHFRECVDSDEVG